MSDEKKTIQGTPKNPDNRYLKVKIIRPFMESGVMLEAGKEAELEFKRACRHMKAGDVERNEEAITEYKNSQISDAKAKIKDAEKDW